MAKKEEKKQKTRKGKTGKNKPKVKEVIEQGIKRNNRGRPGWIRTN